MWCTKLNFLDFDYVPSPSMYCNAIYLTRANRNNEVMVDIVEENDVNET